MLTTRSLQAQRTEFKFKKGNTPIDFSKLSITPVVHSPFGDTKSAVYNTYSGVPGVYLWVYLLDATRTYIGSSVNLGSRMETYCDIMMGYKTPKTAAEKEFANTSPSSWALIILDVCSPAEARVLEQLALINFHPTMNKSLEVQNAPVPGLATHSAGIDLALNLALSFSAVSSSLSALFAAMRQRLSDYDAALQSNLVEGVVDGTPVWVYSVHNAVAPILIFGSITRAKTQLRMRYSTLADHVKDKVLAAGNTIALSFSPLSVREVHQYTKVDLTTVRVATRSEIYVYSATGVFITTYPSSTKAAPHLNVSRQLLDKQVTKTLNLGGRSYMHQGQKVYLRKVTHLRNP